MPVCRRTTLPGRSAADFRSLGADRQLSHLIRATLADCGMAGYRECKRIADMPERREATIRGAAFTSLRDS